MSRKSRYSFAVVVFAMVVLSFASIACSGGGGGDVVSTPEPHNCGDGYVWDGTNSMCVRTYQPQPQQVQAQSQSQQGSVNSIQCVIAGQTNSGCINK